MILRRGQGIRPPKNGADWAIGTRPSAIRLHPSPGPTYPQAASHADRVELRACDAIRRQADPLGHRSHPRSIEMQPTSQLKKGRNNERYTTTNLIAHEPRTIFLRLWNLFWPCASMRSSLGSELCGVFQSQGAYLPVRAWGSLTITPNYASALSLFSCTRLRPRHFL